MTSIDLPALYVQLSNLVKRLADGIRGLTVDDGHFVLRMIRGTRRKAAKIEFATGDQVKYALGITPNQADFRIVARPGANEVEQLAISPNAVKISGVNFADALAAKADATALEGKAATEHSHEMADVTGLDIALTAKADASALEGKADTEHGHEMADVTGLDSALSGKAAREHSHEMADVTGLDIALTAKAAREHSHEMADVTGLDIALTAKADASALEGKADTEHDHELADVRGLQAALSGKASASEIAPLQSQIASLTSLQGSLANISDDAQRIAFPAAGLQSMQVFATPGTHIWRKPAGIRRIRVYVTGGGGSGYSALRASTTGDGGGGGGTAIKIIDVSAPLSQISMTVGSGDSGPGNGVRIPNRQRYGGVSSFGNYCTGTGGGGSGYHVGGGRGVGGDINIRGGDPFKTFPHELRAPVRFSRGGPGGESFFSPATTHDMAGVYGGGGGGIGYRSGGRFYTAGGDGIIVIEEYA